MSAQIDVAIVGGGAAGIAAARRLAALHRSVMLIEALPQLGGRARTLNVGTLPLDMGCGWLHSARRNPLTAIAEAHAEILDRSRSAWHKQLRDIHFPAAKQREAWAAFQRLSEQLHHDPPAGDCVADAVARDDRWRPFLDGVSSFINGTELGQLSVRDYLAYEDASSDDNWRLPKGYGAFIVGLAAGVPVACETPVESISCDAEVVLTTPRGAIHARAVIVTVSTTVLAQGHIRFEPAVDDHLQAASRLPLGLADKVYLALDDPEAVPAESHLLGHIDRAETGSYYLRPFGRPLVECYLGGAWARSLEAAGTQAACDFAIAELRDLLGEQFARGLTPLAVSRWGHEPTIGGSYSHALPGHAAARSVLVQPVSERFCFAGEACSKQDFSTAHGAWESGLEAAETIERFLAKR